MKKNCLYCGKKLTANQQHNIFCSVKCAGEYKKKKNIEDWLNGINTGSKKNGEISSFVRNYLLEKNNFKCELCGWGEMNTFTKKIPLEIHHIDGDYSNNCLENLQVLCPNCHSLTPNYKALNTSNRIRTQVRKQNYCIDCGAQITIGATRCKSCAGKERITEKPVSREELKKLIRSHSFVSIGEQFGVTDNTIRKWCIRYGLPSKRKDIKLYSEEEWDQI